MAGRYYLPVFWLFVSIATASCSSANSAQSMASPVDRITYNTEPTGLLKMNMTNSIEINGVVDFSGNHEVFSGKPLRNLTIAFKAQTVSPQFDILSLDQHVITYTTRQLSEAKFSPSFKFKIKAEYIGHAIIRPMAVWNNDGVNVSMKSDENTQLKVLVTSYQGIWEKIFVISVAIFMLISYASLGAQLDKENLLQIIKAPKTMLLGFIISVTVMPAVSWYVCRWLLYDQQIYRVGSFIFACGPTATAATLWTVMLNSDKELSVSLQVISTIGAIFTMPTLLYVMDRAMVGEVARLTIKVPFLRLIETLVALLVSLIIGWYLANRSKKFREYSQLLFRPLIYSALLFIIIFSTVVYWFIYQMFDLRLTMMAFLITALTYSLTAAFGYLTNKNWDHAIAISISSTYKNSGIAFAVLVVAFESPDTFIAFVPCLIQVVTTSLSLYLIYSTLRLIDCVKRRGQPEPIQAIAGDVEAASSKGDSARKQTDTSEQIEPKKDSKGRSYSGQSSKSCKSGENEELIAMSVTDGVPASPPIAEEPNEANSEKPTEEEAGVLANQEKYGEVYKATTTPNDS